MKSESDNINSNSFAEIKKTSNNLANLLNQSKKIDKKVIDDALELSDKIGINCRKLLENIPINDAKSVSDNYETEEKKYINIKFNDNILQISCPYTLKRMTKKYADQKNYLLGNQVGIALKEWQKLTGFSLKKSINAPYIVLIIRTGTHYDRTKICDNDNIENGRIVNEIASALGYSDNAMQMDLYSCFRVKENAKHFGTEFIVCSRKDFLKAYENVITE